jgi:transposase
MPYINGTDRDQLSLLPRSLDEQIARDSDVRVLDKFVSSLPLRELGFSRTSDEPVAGAGAPVYSAAALLRVLLYGFHFRLPSSRRLAWLCATNVEMQWLTGNLRPSHMTICTFVKENDLGVRQLFRRFVQFLKMAELVDGQLVAIDGTKIKANAARDMVSMASTERAIARADAEIAKYVAMLQEDNHDDDPPGGGLHARVEALGGVEAVRARMETLEQRKNEQAALQQELTERNKKYYSPADPDAEMMRTRQGKVPAYNYQIAVDSKNRFIVDETLVQDQNDTQQLAPCTQSVREALGTVHNIVMDNGYYNGNHIAQVETLHGQNELQATTVYVNLQRTDGKDAEGFIYDAEHDVYRCPQDRELVRTQSNRTYNHSRYTVYQSRHCDGCPIRSACTTSKTGRQIQRHEHAEAIQRHRDRARSPQGKELLRQRKTIVEHVCGNVKAIIGSSFRTRGQPRVATEARLGSISYNLKRLINIWTGDIEQKLALFNLQTSMSN